MKIRIKTTSVEQEIVPYSGYSILILHLPIILAIPVCWYLLAYFYYLPNLVPVSVVSVSLLIIVAVLIAIGYFTLQPNEARLLILFGSYHGTVSKSGFHWANPFYTRVRAKIPLTSEEMSHQPVTKQQNPFVQNFRRLSTTLSLRTRNFNSKKLKVNDKAGNPIEIAVVVVWHVEDTAKAAFDVEDFETYVEIQSEGAIRHIASLYNYDEGENYEPTLRNSADEVTEALKVELQKRMDKAGLRVEETRLIHLAYAPEIAQVMLRRQQAEAVIAARKRIVFGAVSMVEMALQELSAKQVVHLDEERKAAMVSNLLVVLCSESDVRPVLNTGTLYP